MADGIKKLNENIIAPGRSLVINNQSVRDNDNFEKGTLRCNPSSGGLRYKYDTNNYRLFDAYFILEERTIVDALIGNQEVTTRTLKDLCVTEDKISDRAVTRQKIGYKAVGEQEIDDNAVKTIHITDQNVTTDKIKDIAITSDKIKDLAVIKGKIGEYAVESANIESSAVTTSKIATGAIVNEKILGNTIENDRLKNFTIQGGNETGIGKIAEKTITSFNIADNTITDTQIKDGAITGSKIANGTIKSNNIANNTIESGNIATGAIISDKLGESSVITDKIMDKSITKDKLSDDLFSTIDNAVVYELDENGNSCVKIKDNTYFNVLGGDVDVNGNLTATRVYNMAYSDLAEGYVPGEDLEPGDEAYLREDGKVYRTGPCYVGIVSDEYAMCLGASDEELNNKEKIAIALIGKVHVKTKYATNLGHNISRAHSFGYIGKALETKFDIDEIEQYGYQKVLALVYPS